MRQLLQALALCTIIPFAAIDSKNGITFFLTRGRVGDQMIAYAQTVFFGTIYDLDIFFTPFAGSDHFKLHTAHEFFNEKNNTFTIKEFITKDTNFCSKTAQTTLYINTLNTKKSPFVNLDSIQTVALEYPWFKQKLQELFTPTIPVRQIEEAPQGYISVAIHVRTGSGTDKGCIGRQLFDSNDYYNFPEKVIDKSHLNLLFSDERYPNKFPPYQFYIDQIDLLTQLFPDKKFYIYIFTDHKNPTFVADVFAENIQRKTHCIFAIHSKEVQKDISVEDDFYGMAQFDILIRAGSNLSRAAQLFGNHKIVIYIKKARWHNDAVVPDSIGLIIYNKNSSRFKEINLATQDRCNKMTLCSIKKMIKDLSLIFS